MLRYVIVPYYVREWLRLKKRFEIAVFNEAGYRTAIYGPYMTLPDAMAAVLTMAGDLKVG